MPQDNTILNNFHQAKSQQHRQDSIGNQGVFNANPGEQPNQVGSIEYVPNATTQNIDLHLHNTSGEHTSKL